MTSCTRILSISLVAVLGLLLVSLGSVGRLEILENRELIAAWLLAFLPAALASADAALAAARMAVETTALAVCLGGALAAGLPVLAFLPRAERTAHVPSEAPLFATAEPY